MGFLAIWLRQRGKSLAIAIVRFSLLPGIFSGRDSLVATSDGTIRANRFADSRESICRLNHLRESPDSRESFQDSRTFRTLFLRIALWGAKNCELQVRDDSRDSLARYESRGLSVN